MRANRLAHEICGERIETPNPTLSHRPASQASSGHSHVPDAVVATDIVAAVVAAGVAVVVVAVVVAAVEVVVAAVVVDAVAVVAVAVAVVAAVAVVIVAVDTVVVAADPEDNTLEKGTVLAAAVVPSVKRERNTARKQGYVHYKPLRSTS